MAISTLEKNVISMIRSSFSIDNVANCAVELVLNSLDAKATAIAVRVNLQNFRIQVVDNGHGISKSNLQFAGLRYMTSKCHTIFDLRKRLKFYGFRGEAISSISDVSKKITIISREANSAETYEKIMENGQASIKVGKSRPSVGTTVTVEGFLCHLPVRQQRIKNNEIENIKKYLESLVIIHPKISFSLRNDVNGKLLIESQKCLDIMSSFKNIHPFVSENEFILQRISKDGTKVEGLFNKQLHENKKLQYIYVNKRPVSCPRIANLVSSLFKKVCSKTNASSKKHPIFLLHIKCPYSEIDITLEPTKTSVFFKRTDLIEKCVEKLVYAFLGPGNFKKNEKIVKKPMSEFGISQIFGAIKATGAKRHLEMLSQEVPDKIPKIIEETPVFDDVSRRSQDTDQNHPVEEEDEEAIASIPNDIKENTLFTDFPEDENKGKDIIMDMFIKSVQVFPKECNISEYSQSPPPAVDDRPSSSQNKVSQSIQTTLNQTLHREISSQKQSDQMVSIGVQTEPSNAHEECVGFYKKSEIPRKSLQKYTSDYDYDFSKITAPNIKLAKQFTTNLPFDETRKLFDFQANQSNIVLPDFTFIDNDDLQSELCNTTCLKGVKFTPMPKSILKPTQERNKKNPVQQSPYFLKNSKPSVNLKKIQEEFKVPFDCKQRRAAVTSDDSFSKDSLTVDYTDASVQPEKEKLFKSFLDKKSNTLEVTPYRPKQSKDLFDDTVSRYFTPAKKDKEKDLDFENSELNYIKRLSQEVNSQSNCELDATCDLFSPSRNSKKSSYLAITLNKSQEKSNIFDEDLQFKQRFLKDNFETLTATRAEKSPFSHEVIVKTNPKEDVFFHFTKRYEFLPKGSSPLLKDHAEVDPLTPEGRENFQNAVIQEYDDELLLVKWQNYIHSGDSKRFFEDIYMEKSKQIEDPIPSVTKNSYEKRIARIVDASSFTKEIFNDLVIVGQVDRKFIAAVDQRINLLFLFDQHAVHERVRVELLSESYKNASSKIDNAVTLFLPQKDIKLLKTQKTTLISLGLHFELFTDGIIVLQVPRCVYNKSTKGANLLELTEKLIKEVIETLRSNNGMLINTPRVIQDIVNSEACRGAIKFGDSLSKDECSTHLKNLSQCKLPFQCAHGRPTLTPLISLSKELSSQNMSKPNLKKLRG